MYRYWLTLSIVSRHARSRMPMETKLVTSDSWSLLPKEERERCELAATRLKEQHISMPWFREKDQRSGDEFWASFYDSRVNT